MPILQTKLFAKVSYQENSVIEFPAGLPGFEDRRHFVALQFADTAPLVFLQSLENPALCFTTLPVRAVDSDYRLQVTAEDRELIGLPPAGRLRIGEEVLALAIVSVRETGPTANLLAPVIINLRNRRAVQAVSTDGSYSHQHALVSEEAAVCS